MEKSKLERFISKYTLGGMCEQVLFESKGTDLTVRAISEDKNVVAEVSATDISFPAGSFGVFETKKLRSIMSVLGDTIKVTPISGNTGLTISDGRIDATFVLADVAVIPKVPEVRVPQMDIMFEIDEAFITTFIRAKAAMSEAETFTVISDDSSKTSAKVILGFSSNNTNRISIPVSIKDHANISVSFSANCLKEILSANKEMKQGAVEVSSKGMCKVTFMNAEYTSVYYLPKV